MIVVDVQAVQDVLHGERGISRYTFELAKELSARHPGLVDVFAYDERLPRVDKLDELAGDRTLRSFGELRGRRADLVHVNAPFGRRLYEMSVPVRAASTVVTCYDLIPYLFSEHYLQNAQVRASYMSRLPMLIAADAIVTDSDSAASDAVLHLGIDPSIITTIGAGTAPQFSPPSDTTAERLRCLRRDFPSLLDRYVMVPAGAEWRKNVTAAAEAFQRLGPDDRAGIQFVIASRFSPEELADFQSMLADLGIADQVLVTGLVSDVQMVLLYQTADIVFVPSLYEGFGLPVLEARRCGSRVICSNSSSMPEVMMESAALFDPRDMDHMTDTLRRALHDPETRRRLDAAPDPDFTWAQAADALATVYVNTVARARSRGEREANGGPTRRRLAVVLPREQVAVLSTLLQRLDAVADVMLFVASKAVGPTEVDGVWVRDVGALPSMVASGDVDTAVYLVGDDRLDRRVEHAIRFVPGPAVVGFFAGDSSPLTTDQVIDWSTELIDVSSARSESPSTLVDITYRRVVSALAVSGWLEFPST